MGVFDKFRATALSKDHQRNLKVLIVASLLNFSFAVEKILLSFNINMGDPFWACIYGLLALYTTYVAAVDYVFDVIEDSEHPGEHLSRRISPTV